VQPAGPGARGRDLRQAPLVRRDGPLDHEPADDRQARLRARCPAPRPQPPAPGRRLRPPLRGAVAGGRGDGPGARGDRAGSSAHEPYPAVVVEGHWNLLASNDAVGALLEGISPALLEPPANVLRISLHPDGMAPRIVNLGQWRGHLLQRLRRQIALSGDPELVALADEAQDWPAGEERGELPAQEIVARFACSRTLVSWPSSARSRPSARRSRSRPRRSRSNRSTPPTARAPPRSHPLRRDERRHLSNPRAGLGGSIETAAVRAVTSPSPGAPRLRGR
jgi:hypothetical protein